MKVNIGTLDRMLRIVGGLTLIAMTTTGIVGIWGWLGLIPLGTGLMRRCPVYSLIGVSTCSTP